MNYEVNISFIVNLFSERRSLSVPCTDSIKINRPGYNKRMYYLTNFLQRTVHVEENINKKFVFHIFTLLLAHLMPKLGNHSRHSESLKNV